MRHRISRWIQTGTAFLVITPAISDACTCSDPGRISEDKVIEAMCQVDAVFVGKATDLSSTPGQSRRVNVEPITVYKGDVSKPVVATTSTTCDHWYTPSDSYLIFGNIENDSNSLATSICGPTRLTGKVVNARFQLSIIEESVARIDDLCGSVESGARQKRIIRQDRIDTEAFRAESVRLFKEGLKQSRDDYEQALEDTKSVGQEEK